MTFFKVGKLESTEENIIVRYHPGGTLKSASGFVAIGTNHYSIGFHRCSNSNHVPKEGIL